ncbi:hypothetical protein GCM10012275_52430 [Longimycelium tulufanense]|uniref:Condensation domain-containing protein n=1 Tax=Longimycelium tulufanense TaxID=907463 RepID=A0A8J3FXL8_9PSEU|nr:hypothetical protein [Longimycelium tulufanense]GGM75253.1 hypothetical protein GCM10012275_52430 [Longimycelium tulufanense]
MVTTAGTTPDSGDRRYGSAFRVPLTDQDQWFLYAPSLLGIQFEVRVAGRLCPERLRKAIVAVTRRHPLARARLVPGSALTTRHQWEIPAEAGPPRVDVVECGGDAARVDGVRVARYADTPSVHASPPFALTLAHRDGGDHLMLNLPHAVADGISAYLLVRAILSAYHEAADPGPLVTTFDAPRPQARRTSGRWPNQGYRARKGVPVATNPAGARSGDPDHGVGIELVRIGREETRALLARRRQPTSLNDVLAAALVVTIRHWNADHGGAMGQVSLMVAVNARPQDQKYEGIGNLATGAVLSLPATVPASMEPMTKAVTDQMRPVKENRFGRSPLEPSGAVAMFPSALKKAVTPLGMLWFGPPTGLLSNLGTLDWPDFGSAACAVREAWFSPPLDPWSVCLGAASSYEELFLAFRYDRARMGPATAAAFAALYREVLTGPQ